MQTQAYSTSIRWKLCWLLAVLMQLFSFQFLLCFVLLFFRCLFACLFLGLHTKSPYALLQCLKIIIAEDQYQENICGSSWCTNRFTLVWFCFFQQMQLKLHAKSKGITLYSAAYWFFMTFLWNIDAGVLNMCTRRIFICHNILINWIFCSLFLWEQVLLNKHPLNNILLFLIILIIIQYVTLK